MTPILWRSLLCSWSGWGRASWRLAEAVERAGRRVAFDASIGADEEFGAIPEFVRSRLAKAGQRASVRLQVSGPPRPGLDVPAGSVMFTMWESTGVSPAWADQINRCKALVVPSAFNAATFSAGGVAVPVFTCPLGADTSVFRPGKRPRNEAFTVGMAGRWHLGGTRKGHVEGMRAFREAFAGRDDVRLEVKCWPDDPVPDFGDSRIRLIRETWTDEELAGWYSSLDLYLDPSLGEGWGLQTQEAMCCGAPVATTLWSGRAEFCHPGCVIPLEYDLLPGPPPYAGLGVMAHPRHASLVRALRGADERRDALPELGAIGARHASRFTWDAAAQRLVEILDRATGF